MAIARIQGPMLQSDLLRYGVDFAVETDLLYFDVANNRLGVKTTTPSQPLHVIGGATVDTISVTGDVISSIVTNNDINITPDGTGYVVASKAKVSNLTLDSVVFVSSNTGELNDDVGLTYTTGGGLVSTLAHLGQIDFATNNISRSGDINITATGNEVVLNSARITDLTASRILYAGPLQEISDDANFTWNSGTSTMGITGAITVDNITLDGSVVSSGTGALVLTSPATIITEITGTTGVRVPAGSIVQRPSVPTAADLRFNTDTLQLEYYDGTTWVIAGTDFQAISSDVFNGDDTTTVFVLSESAANASNLIVAINGVVQQPGTAYSVVGTALTFVSAPATLDTVDVRNVTRSTSFDFVSDSTGDTKIEVTTGDVVATATNGVLDATGVKTVRFPSYTVVQTNALTGVSAGDTVWVTDATPAPTLATYDGINWKAMTVSGTLA